MAETKFSLKLLINSQNNSVLFAEASKDFVDFLSHLMSLPIATVIKLLQEQEMAGCLENLYRSIDTMNVNTYIQSGWSKDSFLKIIGLPAVLQTGPVPLMILDEPNEKCAFYKCIYCYNSGYTNDQRVLCPSCCRKMTSALKFVPLPPTEGRIGEATVKGVVTYMVTDDLVVKPMSAVSSLEMMGKFNLKNINVLKEKEVHVGRNEALKLLEASLHSKKVLTLVFKEHLKGFERYVEPVRIPGRVG